MITAPVSRSERLYVFVPRSPRNLCDNLILIARIRSRKLWFSWPAKPCTECWLCITSPNFIHDKCLFPIPSCIPVKKTSRFYRVSKCLPSTSRPTVSQKWKAEICLNNRWPKKPTTFEKCAHNYCPKVKLGRTFLPQGENCAHIFAPKWKLCAHFCPKANLKNVFQTK